MKITNKEEFEKQNVFGTGNANTAYAQYFIGESFLNPLTNPENGLFLANVTFEPGCRNNWHIHHATKGGGQLLVCTAGEGWYQEEGKEAVSLVPGTVITISAEVKHWHGAKKDSWFSHIAVEVPGENCSNEWCEPVSETDMLQQMIDKEENARMYQCIHELQEPFKEVFMLRMMGNLSFQEIGDIFGKSEVWARVTFYRAKERLREQIKK